MSDHAFLFSLRLPGTGRFAAMLIDLTSNLLHHLGFTPVAIAEISGELQAGLPPGKVGGAGPAEIPEITVQFEARDGEIEIVVWRAGRRIIRVSRRLP